MKKELINTKKEGLLKDSARVFHNMHLQSHNSAIVMMMLLFLMLGGKLNAQKRPASLLSESVFQDPALNIYKPLTWWHWINGNVTKDGIRKDLLDMKHKGIGGVQMFDTHMYLPPGPVRYGSDKWYAHVRFAIKICDSLGLEFYMSNSPGWSGSGGPWITLNQSMKKLVYSETKMPARSIASITLSQPQAYQGYYKDIAVVAIRESKAGVSQELIDRNAMAKMPYLPDNIPGDDTANALQPNDIIDVTAYYDVAANKLNWKGAPGKWVILRFGYTATGKKLHPAVDEGTGYEVDKLDTAAVRFQFEQTVGRMIREAGAYTGKTFKGILFDSFEGGFQNWTPSLPGQFEKIKGYSLLKYLPILAGRKMGSEKLTYAFLWDFHDVLTRLLATNYYGTMQKLAQRSNLKLFIEGQGGPMSPAYVNAYADVPMNEFWTLGVDARAPLIKQTVSIAQILGKNIIGAESFTATPEGGKWQNTPGNMKGTGDYAFALGINKFIFHTYTHQPFNLKPGFTMGRYGTHFGRNNTWWPYAGAWINYLSRCQYLLQQGNTVADVCLLFPRDVVYSFAQNTPKIPEGYNYNICYPDYLATAKWVNNRLQFPSGALYKMLVLPEYSYMPLSTLKDIYRLLKEGCIVSGTPPLAPPDMEGVVSDNTVYNELIREIWGGLDGKRNTNKSVENGEVFWGSPIKEILNHYSFQEDVKFIKATAADSLKYIHRSTGNSDIYFISNQADRKVSFQAIFRVDSNLRPEFWEPVSGNVYEAGVFKAANSGVSLPLSLPPSGSIFIVFRQPLLKKDP
ncbi:glycosyl hydrolase [Niabella ginsengisoli]|uniref:Glycoside hydrolase n=1 Tax=Niabella ginsengisoli TaxID=522298 RepID=A0ABS9SJ62_9BACT|nr:glycosyl hydrolase [Niabella ginsengisoli]MCH5598404.1 hypothetical protein [Niabella ginsengisoli]